MKPQGGRADTPDVAVLGGVDLAELKRLIRLVQKTGIGELEVRSGARAIRISAPAAGPGQANAVTETPHASSGTDRRGPAETTPTAVVTKPDTSVPIVSPMVGTFYRAPAPDADPYVEVGDTVEVGQTVCIVEAMKLMNEIESEVRGRVIQILPQNAQPVEFGQKLFLVEPL
jgi:oxaloacetate decarboxylase alpha subunit